MSQSEPHKNCSADDIFLEAHWKKPDWKPLKSNLPAGVAYFTDELEEELENTQQQNQ